jgi:hypothetical protein
LLSTEQSSQHRFIHVSVSSDAEPYFPDRQINAVPVAKVLNRI